MSKISIAVCSCILALVVLTCSFGITNTGFFSSGRSIVGTLTSAINSIGSGVVNVFKSAAGYREMTYHCVLAVENGYRGAGVTVYRTANSDFMQILSYDSDVISTDTYPIAKALYVTVDSWKHKVTFYDAAYTELFTTSWISWTS